MSPFRKRCVNIFFKQNYVELFRSQHQFVVDKLNIKNARFLS